MTYSTSTYTQDSDENGHTCDPSNDTCCSGGCFPQWRALPGGDGIWQSYSTPNSSNLSVQREHGHRTPHGMSYTEHHAHEEMTPALPNPFYYDSSSSGSTVAGPSGQQRAGGGGGGGGDTRPQSIPSGMGSNAGQQQAGYQSYSQQGMFYGQQGGQQQQQQQQHMQPQNIPNNQGNQGYYGGGGYPVQQGGGVQGQEGSQYVGSPLAYGTFVDNPPPGPGYSDGGYEGDGSYPASYNSGTQSVGGRGGDAGSYSSSQASSGRSHASSSRSHGISGRKKRT